MPLGKEVLHTEGGSICGQSNLSCQGAEIHHHHRSETGCQE